MYYLYHSIRFQCTGCGKCCTGDKDSYVEVTKKEARQIQRRLGVSPAWFRRRYVSEYQGQTIIPTNGDGRCPFLDSANCCRVYTVRPRQCRSYPYWPELVHSHAGWLAEAKQCEGINRGPIIAKTKITAFLQSNDK